MFPFIYSYTRLVQRQINECMSVHETKLRHFHCMSCYSLYSEVNMQKLEEKKTVAMKGGVWYDSE